MFCKTDSINYPKAFLVPTLFFFLDPLSCTYLNQQVSCLSKVTLLIEIYFPFFYPRFLKICGFSQDDITAGASRLWEDHIAAGTCWKDGQGSKGIVIKKLKSFCENALFGGCSENNVQLFEKQSIFGNSEKIF